MYYDELTSNQKLIGETPYLKKKEENIFGDHSLEFS